jgi:hypothetical protein
MCSVAALPDCKKFDQWTRPDQLNLREMEIQVVNSAEDSSSGSFQFEEVEFVPEFFKDEELKVPCLDVLPVFGSASIYLTGNVRNDITEICAKMGVCRFFIHQAI